MESSLNSTTSKKAETLSYVVAAFPHLPRAVRPEHLKHRGGDESLNQDTPCAPHLNESLHHLQAARPPLHSRNSQEALSLSHSPRTTWGKDPTGKISKPVERLSFLLVEKHLRFSLRVNMDQRPPRHTSVAPVMELGRFRVTGGNRELRDAHPSAGNHGHQASHTADRVPLCS